ncbi:MAG TPA: HAMP domain-containing sensor histidine kinase [Thermoanaerobaculia bacterium]
MRFARLDTLILFLVYFLGVTVLTRVAGVAIERAAVALASVGLIAVAGFLLHAGLRRRVTPAPALRTAPASAETARALEADLQLAAQMRGLAGLFMGQAHDLRAPINAMVLNLELLKRSLAGAEGSTEQRRIAVIEEELGYLQRSLERLLAQTSPARPSVVRYDLGKLVAEVGELLAPQARQQKVKLAVDVPERRLLTRGSPELTRQALINLAVNGFEALADGGHLELAVEPDGQEIAVRLRDDGPGVAPEIRERILELHFTTKKAGAGVGLYVTRAIIESQGGSLRLAETSAAGSTFELRLPRAGEA